MLVLGGSVWIPFEIVYGPVFTGLRPFSLRKSRSSFRSRFSSFSNLFIYLAMVGAESFGWISTSKKDANTNVFHTYTFKDLLLIFRLYKGEYEHQIGPWHGGQRDCCQFRQRSSGQGDLAPEPLVAALPVSQEKPVNFYWNVWNVDECWMNWIVYW